MTQFLSMVISVYFLPKLLSQKSLQQCSIYATVWSIWLEHNSRTFNDRFSDMQVLLDRIKHLDSIWCKVYSLFRGISLLDILRDWKTMLH